MSHAKTLFSLTLLFISYLSSFGQTLEFQKTNIFPDDGPTPTDVSGFSFTDTYIPSNSYWASPFTEDHVYHARLKYDHPTNPDNSYELRLGKGGQIYSFLTSSGETVPPQYPTIAPWVDEVWQMVAVDGSLNQPEEDKAYFIHQAGVYLKTPEQTLPFYSPIVAEYHNSADNSYTVVNWGQQAHTSDNLISGYTSSLLYYTRYKNLGDGLIQVDLLMYNFGNDNMNFINIPWGGVRRSTYDHWFSSNTDHTYQEETGVFTSYSQPLNQTGGWAAFSSDAQGDAPTLALLMDNDEGTLRLGDAGTIANRDYTVFEGIKFPGTDLGPGKAIRARNFYLLDSDIDDIKNKITTQTLEDETFYGSHNQTSSEVDGTTYAFEYQANELVVTEVPLADGLPLKLRPYQDSQPLFLIKSTTGEYRITTDLYTYSPLPYDGNLENVQLLGFTDNATTVGVNQAIICAGEDYTFADGTTNANINATTYHVSDVGTAYNGYDSLIFTTVYATLADVPAVTSLNNGPGGVGGDNGATSLALWLDASRLSASNTNPSNGSTIDEWTDLSGNTNHYSGSSLNRPTFSDAGTFNAINFDASASNPQFLTGSTEANYPYGTVFMALNAIDAGDNNPLLSNADFSLKYEQNTNAGFLGYSDIGNADYTSMLPSTFGSDNIVSFQTDCANTSLIINSGNNSDNVNIAATTNGIPLGQLGTSSEVISGDFYEVIAFQSNLNTVEKILVDNYLSAKYGSIPITNDLYDKDDVANGDFDHDVAGIGRLDASNIHDSARGTGILEIKNPTSLNDGEFLIWGDNGLDLAFTNTNNLANFLAAKTEKIWNVSEVNTALAVVDVGLVDLKFDLAGVSIADLETVVLLIDSNNDGLFDDENFISSTSIENEDYEGQAFVNFNALDLEDGKQFCLAYLTPDGPGGVFENLALWLAADGQVSTNGGQVANWSDKSAYKKTATGGLGPVLSTSDAKLLNYNPVMTLDGVNDQFAVSSIARAETSSDLNIFIVHRLNAAPHQSTILREGVSGGGISSHLPWSSGRVFWDAGISSGDGRINTPSGLSSGDDALWMLSNHDGTSDEQYIRKNGKTLATDNTAISIIGNNSSFYIGSTGSGLYCNGDIAEVIAYVGNDELQDNQRARIESYLAVKYGYTLDNSLGGTAGDYINSNDVKTWDAAESASYHNDVMGICRDDASDLSQKQSITRDGDFSIYLGNLSAYNGQNTATISTDLSSLLVGHNQGLLNDPTAGATTEKPSGILSRLEREWKLRNTNFTDDFAIRVETDNWDFDINDIRLLVDEDGDFTNAQIYGSPELNISEGSIIISGINSSMIPMNSTRYISIGTINSALPIELISFEAKPKSGVVYLDWRTASELNNDYFTIERTQNKREWENIANVEAVGNSTTINSYAEEDTKPYLGQSYYRLKQTDVDGQFSYSSIKSVYISPNQETIKLYPNPASSKITIEGHPDELKDFRIVNMLGQDVTTNTTIARQEDRFEIDLFRLPTGFYTVQTKSSVLKFMKR